MVVEATTHPSPLSGLTAAHREDGRGVKRAMETHLAGIVITSDKSRQEKTIGVLSSLQRVQWTRDSRTVHRTSLFT